VEKILYSKALLLWRRMEVRVLEKRKEKVEEIEYFDRGEL